MRCSKVSTRNFSSSSSSSDHDEKTIPASARAGATFSRKISSIHGRMRSSRSRTSTSCWAGDRPSELGVVMPAASWSFRPATRTWKNSSRFWLKIARNLARSRVGTDSSSARVSTRSLKSSHDSSRLNWRGTGASASGSGSVIRSRYRRTPGAQVETGLRVVVFLVTEIPLQQDVLALRVADDALAVAPELRVVRREEDEPGGDPGPEVVDHLAIAERRPHLPVRRDRPEVHDLGVG